MSTRPTARKYNQTESARDQRDAERATNMKKESERRATERDLLRGRTPTRDSAAGKRERSRSRSRSRSPSPPRKLVLENVDNDCDDDLDDDAKDGEAVAYYIDAMKAREDMRRAHDKALVDQILALQSDGPLSKKIVRACVSRPSSHKSEWGIWHDAGYRTGDDDGFSKYFFNSSASGVQYQTWYMIDVLVDFDEDDDEYENDEAMVTLSLTQSTVIKATKPDEYKTPHFDEAPGIDVNNVTLALKSYTIPEKDLSDGVGALATAAVEFLALMRARFEFDADADAAIGEVGLFLSRVDTHDMNSTFDVDDEDQRDNCVNFSVLVHATTPDGKTVDLK